MVHGGPEATTRSTRRPRDGPGGGADQDQQQRSPGTRGEGKATLASHHNTQRSLHLPYHNYNILS